MITLLIISTITLIVFLLWNIFLFGIPSSLSFTYYLLKQRFKGNMKYLFTLMCWVCSFTLAPVWFEVSPENIQFLPFLACGGLLFVGTAAAYFDEMTKTVHYTSAGICGVSTFLWLCLMGMWVVPVGLLVVSGIVSIFDKKNTLWWVEMALFGSGYVGLWIYVLGGALKIN